MNSDRAEMNDIIDHLNAWCDEDERAAHAAGRVVMTGNGAHPHHWRVNGEDDVVVRDSGGYIATGPYGCSVGEAAEHIARHDPARVLAEVEVIRQVINDYRASDGAILRGDPDPDNPGWRGIYAGRDAFASVLRAFAKAAGWKRDARLPHQDAGEA